MQKIFIAKEANPYASTLAVLYKMDLSSFKGRRVLIKPNVGRIAPSGQGIVTDKMVVAAAIDAFTSSGAKVAVGESPIKGVNVLEAFETSGIKAVAEERNCRLIDLDAGGYTKVPAPNGQAVKHFKVCKDVLSFDAIISVPVMKTHMHTGVTLSIKNMKGCLWKRSKVDLHMLPPVSGSPEKPIDIAIADMSGVLRPHMSLIDGTVCMEGLGPSAGKIKKLGVVLAGTDPFATDAVACSLMGMKAEDIPHLKIAAERGYGVIDLKQVTIFPDTYKEWTSRFIKPPESISIEFPNIKVLDKNSCSACQSTLLLFLKRYRNALFDYFPEKTCIHFAIGKGHQDVPEGTILVGNCTASLRKNAIFIQGCPPVGSEIMQAISGKPCVDYMDGHSKTPDME